MTIESTVHPDELTLDETPAEEFPGDVLPARSTIEDAARLTRLHERLEDVAVGFAAPEVCFRVVQSPLGELLVAATEQGVVRVAFQLEDLDAVVQRLADRISPRILRAPKRLDRVARWFDAYFAGGTEPYDGPLDLRLASGFRLQVLDHLREVPYGERISYARLAAAAGSPRAVRATGTACATNPLPLLIPCHRVVRSGGAIGAYLGGTAAKVRLLGLESEHA